MNQLLQNLLRCPDCRQPTLTFEESKNDIVCTHCQARFPWFRQRPVLLRHDNLVFPLHSYLSTNPSPLQPDSFRWTALIPNISVNLSSSHSLTRFAEMLAKLDNAKILIVGSGSQRTWLDKRFATFPNIHLIYCDIDTSALIDCYCDAHELPFLEASFDGVITTAVLEHVLYPERVAEEIARVLKVGGLLYSELPFMQQVHEGAYDFTRYTLSGHRRLFNYFSEIDSGMVAGPATTLVWAIENFVLAFVTNKKLRLAIKGIVRSMTFWIKYFDYFLRNRPAAMDGASCTYFLGKKQLQKISDQEIINRYVGAKAISHL